MKEHVVLLHGIWMTGLELSTLRKRIAAAGFQTSVFHYQSLLNRPADNAKKLQQHLEGIDADIVHFVAHSLGGIVLTHLFDQQTQRPGRVVMLGTPLKASATAGAYYALWITRPLLGRSTTAGLLGGRPCWKGGSQLGVIAGDRGRGIGKLLFGKLPSPNDGTVALDETLTDEVTKHLTVPFGHFGMLFAAPVAESVCRFLKSGEFL